MSRVASGGSIRRELVFSSRGLLVVKGNEHSTGLAQATGLKPYLRSKFLRSSFSASNTLSHEFFAGIESFELLYASRMDRSSITRDLVSCDWSPNAKQASRLDRCLPSKTRH